MTGDTCHMSCVTCHVSRVTCHMSHVTYHMSRVSCNLFKFFYLFIFTISAPNKIIRPMIRIGREIQCLPYAGFLYTALHCVYTYLISPVSPTQTSALLFWSKDVNSFTFLYPLTSSLPSISPSEKDCLDCTEEM